MLKNVSMQYDLYDSWVNDLGLVQNSTRSVRTCSRRSESFTIYVWNMDFDLWLVQNSTRSVQTWTRNLASGVYHHSHPIFPTGVEGSGSWFENLCVFSSLQHSTRSVRTCSGQSESLTIFQTYQIKPHSFFLSIFLLLDFNILRFAIQLFTSGDHRIKYFSL